MDVPYPYADGLSRLQLLYRLPTAPSPRRLLLVPGRDPGGDVGAGWGTGEVTSVSPTELLRMATTRSSDFDAVALPGTLEPLPSRAQLANGELLAAAAELLAPDGVVVGHMAHGRALRRLARPSQWIGLAAAAFVADAILGPVEVCGALERAGLHTAEGFYVQPQVDSPMGLAPSDPQAARRHFLRDLRSTSHTRGVAGHYLRWAVARVGWGGSFQSQIFFWARKPC